MGHSDSFTFSMPSSLMAIMPPGARSSLADVGRVR
jgi:hypothetical protein